MNKKDFVNEVAGRCMLTPYVVDEVFNISFGVIAENLLKGEQVEVPKLGKFVLREKSATTYTNLFGGKSKTIDKTIYPLFQIATGLKNKVKNGQHNIRTT